nr:zinc finger, CCHC-type [Tanacetum cinerariifolium]
EKSSPYDMIKELKSMFEKQDGVERFDLIQTFHACKQEESKPVIAYVLQMKGYVNQLERFGYMSPQDRVAGLILNGLTKDFVGFVRNYNMHNIRKTIGELHDMLIEYEKVLPKKDETPQGNDKQQVYIPKPKNPKPSAKEHPAKDDTCHYCKEVGYWKRKCLVYLAKLLKKKKQVGFASSSDNFHYAPSITRGVVSVHRLVENGFVQCFTDFGILVSKNNVFYFNAKPSNGVYEIDLHDLVPNVNSIYNVSTVVEFATRILNMVPTKKVDKTPYELWFGKVPNLSYLKVWDCEVFVKRDTSDKLQQRSVKCIFKGYPKETMGYYFYFPHENKIVVARYAEFFEKKLITQEVSGRAVDLEEIQNEDTSPFEIPSKIPMEVEGFEPPQEEVILIRRGSYEPASYKAAMLDSESNKWMDAINAEIQSMIDNMVWVLVDLPPNCKTVGSKWIFKKRTDMDDKILRRYKMDNSKRGHIPMQERLDLNKTQGASTPKEVKRMKMYLMSDVGPIMYAVRCTRPDVAFAQNITSLFQQNPGEGHWTVVKNILKYLRNTKEMFLVYGGNPKVELRVDCYCDAGFETDIDDIISLT